MKNIMRLTRRILLAASTMSLLVVSGLSQAQTGDQVREKLSSIGISVGDITTSDMNGLLEVRTNQGVLFATPDGEYFIAGTLYQLDESGKVTNVLAARQAPINARAIAELRDEVIEYKADNEKYVVTIFTDITCGYCVKLHSQMADYNKLGITVRYLAYPRQGDNGPVAKQMAEIWCADDPKLALDDAKLKQKSLNIDGEKCEPMISKHYTLGQRLGVSGTPAVFLPDGSMVGGYLPPEALLERLENL